MIAKSFRSVGWVASVAAAALCCYLISQRVASERVGLEKMENNILQAKLDVRKLQTELGTRGRMAELERWNNEVLALSAPAAGQYLNGEVALARFEGPAKSAQPAIEPVAYQPKSNQDAAPVATPVSATEAAPAQPMLRHANYVRPAGDDLTSHTRSVALLDSHVLDAIGRAAQGESSGKNRDQ